MNLKTISFRFKFLTPCFSGTAEGRKANHSELRLPPIRGHIRFWHRAAFGLESTNRIWGSASGGEGHGSRVSLTISDNLPPSQQLAPLLPHKDKKEGRRPALPPGTRAGIQLQRLPGCSHDDWRLAEDSVRLWLVAGTLGCRSSRAAGSVWPEEDWAPADSTQLAKLLAPLLNKGWAAALIGYNAEHNEENYGEHTWEQLREAASDTPKGPDDLFGGAQPRKPSPVRFKVVELKTGLFLMAIARSIDLIQRAEKALNHKPNPQRWRELGPWTILREPA
jgi:hypothetical protein